MKDSVQTQILIVDDEETIAYTLAAIAETRGYKAKAAFSAQQALDIAHDFTPDILLTDFSMPHMNGIELATKFSRRFPGCRIFLLTAYMDSAKFQRLPRQPEITILHKPMPPGDLLQAIADPDAVAEVRQPKILNVDDISAHRYSISRLLLRRGFVHEAATGEEALSQLKDNEFDAVLLDIHLPDLDGFEVCRRIREQMKSKVPVLHFTATYHEPTGAATSKSVGADDYVEQPIEPDLLIARLRDVIQQGFTQQCVRGSRQTPS